MKNRIDRALDVLLEVDWLKYLLIGFSPVFYITVMFTVVVVFFNWIWENLGVQNLYFILFKLKKLDKKQKRRILEIWSEKDFKSKINKILWRIAVKNIKKELST